MKTKKRNEYGRVSALPRLKKCLELIEEIAMAGDSNKVEVLKSALSQIYRLVHSARNPSCWKSHPDWSRPLDDAMRLETLAFNKNRSEK